MLIRSDKAPRLWIKMSFFITTATPVYNRGSGMTYVPVILACEQRKWGERGLLRSALCFTIIRVWLKWAHRGVLWIFTIEMNLFGQVHWDCIKCRYLIPMCSLNSQHAICHNKHLYHLKFNACEKTFVPWLYIPFFFYGYVGWLTLNPTILFRQSLICRFAYTQHTSTIATNVTYRGQLPV